MSASDPSFLFDIVRKQAICFLQCVHFNLDWIKLVNFCVEPTLRPRCKRISDDVEAIANDWIRSDPLIGFRKALIAEVKPEHLNNTDQAHEVLLKKFIRLKPGRDPRPMIMTGDNAAPQIFENNLVELWLQLTECIRETTRLDDEIRSLLPNIQQIVEIRTEQEQTSAFETERTEKLDDLCNDFEKLKQRTNVPKGSMRFSDHRAAEWQLYAHAVASYAFDRVQALKYVESTSPRLKSHTSKVTIPVQIDSLVLKSGQIDDPLWIPTVLYESIFSGDAPPGFWTRLRTNVGRMSKGQQVHDESSARRVLAVQMCLAFDEVSRHTGSHGHSDNQLAEWSPWFQNTCQRVLGMNTGQVQVLLDAQSRVDGVEEISVAVDARRRVIQTGVRIVLDAKVDWLQSLKIEVPQKRPHLESKLLELVQSSGDFPEALKTHAVDLLGLLGNPIRKVTLIEWYDTQDPSRQSDALETLHALVRELVIATAQSRSHELKLQSSRLLEMLRSEGVAVLNDETQRLGEGQWTIKLLHEASLDVGIKKLDVNIRIKDTPISESTVIQQQSIGLKLKLFNQESIHETIVLVSNQSKLALYLAKSQGSLHLYYREAPEWTGWKSYCELLISLDQAGGDNFEQLLAALPWLEALCTSMQSEGLAFSNLLRLYLRGLLKALSPLAMTHLIPCLDPDTLSWNLLNQEDCNSINIAWATVEAPHATPIECSHFSVLGHGNNVIRKGVVTVSRGPDFSDALLRAVAIADRGEYPKAMSTNHPLVVFYSKLQSYLWNPSDFEMFCQITKRELLSYLEDEIEGRNWFNLWVHRILQGEELFGWFNWFTEQGWFECLPKIDTQKSKAFWPSGYNSGWRGVTVVASDKPIGDVCDVETAIFGIKGYLVTSTISGGEVLTVNSDAASQIQRLVTTYRDTANFQKIGRPAMRWVAGLRDPLPGASSLDVDVSIILDVLNGLSAYAAGGEAFIADDCLETARRVASLSGYKIQPAEWSFQKPCFDINQLPRDYVKFRFDDLPAGQITLEHFGLTNQSEEFEGKFFYPFHLHLSVGPAPEGYVELEFILDQVMELLGNWPTSVQEAFKQFAATLRDLPRTVTDSESDDPVYAIVELWEESSKTLAPYLSNWVDLTNSNQDARKLRVTDEPLVERWNRNLRKLANSFDLNAYGEIGARIDELHNNFEAWFDYDPLQLSQASRISSGRAPIIKQVDRQGLVRKGSSTPLLKAKIQL